MGGVLYLTESQSINVLGFNMYAFRFLELAGFIRVMARREFSFSRLNRIDQAFLILWAYTTVVFLLRSKENQAVQIGRAVDASLCYLTFRGLMGSVEALREFLRDFALFLAPFAALVLLESIKSRNPFGNTVIDTEWAFRNGRIRCVGPFQFAGNLGTLGVSFLPLYIGLMFARRDRLFAAAGIAFCLLVVWAANSGGPLSAAVVVLASWLLWWQRLNMQRVRRCLVGLLVLLGLVMKAPIWYILMKVSLISGGTGWHRSYLLDMAWQHIKIWGLAGMPARDTAEWFSYLLPSGEIDITCEYVAFGVTAGAPAIALLIHVLTRAFSGLGGALAAVRVGPQACRQDELLLWGLGVALAAHVTNWFGQSYFDQIRAVFYLHLAAISAVAVTGGTDKVFSSTQLVRRGPGNNEAGSVSAGIVDS